MGTLTSFGMEPKGSRENPSLVQVLDTDLQDTGLGHRQTTPDNIKTLVLIICCTVLSVNYQLEQVFVNMCF